MKLELDPGDLRPEAKSTPISLVEYKHLNEATQAAVRVVGKATFYNWARDCYNAVYPPKTTE